MVGYCPTHGYAHHPNLCPDKDNGERARLIEGMLDKIMPIPDDAPRKVCDAIDFDRSMLVIRAGWADMPIDELRKLAAE